MRIKAILALAAATAACGLIGAAGAQAPSPAKSASGQCFMSSEWHGWRPRADNKAIYLNVGIHQVWRADLSDECPELSEPDAHLVTVMRGGGSICNGLDLDLKVSNGMGFAVPCIVTNLTKLTDAEAKALPAKEKP
jgi:hypothetical protein